MRTLILGIALTALIVAPAAACGHSGNNRPAIPAPGASIDGFLPDARLAEAELKQVHALRAEVDTLVAAEREPEARKIEEQAMRILGFKKLWLHCGPGTFIWLKLSPALTQ